MARLFYLKALRTLFLGFLDVYLAEILSLFICLPSLGILESIYLELGNLWHEHSDLCKERSKDEIHETRLALTDLSRFTVAQEAYREALLLFDVALMEELLKQQLGPFDGDVK